MSQGSVKSPVASPILGQSLVQEAMTAQQIQEATRHLISLAQNIPDQSGMLPRFMQLDIRKAPVTTFVEVMTEVLAHQAKEIKDLKENVKKRSTDAKIGDLISQVAHAIPLEELGIQEENHKKCAHQYDDQEVGLMGPSEHLKLREGIDSLQGKMQKMSQRLGLILQTQEKLDLRIQSQGAEIKTKGQETSIMERFEKIEAELKSEVGLRE